MYCRGDLIGVSQAMRHGCQEPALPPITCRKVLTVEKKHDFCDDGIGYTRRIGPFQMLDSEVIFGHGRQTLDKKLASDRESLNQSLLGDPDRASILKE
jgi:hypothetical protein